MSDLYSAVETRIHEVLADGRGVDGSLGTEAQLRAIAAGQFRRATDNAPLDDPNFPAEAFDTGYVIRFDASRDDPAPHNPMQAPQFMASAFTVLVGYVESAGLVGYVNARGSEVAATAVQRAQARALSDGMRIKRALEFAPLRGLDTDPSMVEVTLQSTDLQPLGGGRLVMAVRFRLVIEYDETTAYSP